MSSSNVSRRNVLKGAVATGAIAGATTIAAQQATQARAEESGLGSDFVVGYGEVNWDYQTDYLIVGSGTALPAALTALEAGVSVMVIEKRDTPGGDWGINGGVMYAGGNTSVQAANNVVDERTGESDTLEATLADWMDTCKGECDEVFVKRVVDDGPAMIDYFAERGIEWTVYRSGEHPVERGHQTPSKSGSDLINILVNDIEEKGGTILYNMKGRHVLFDITGRVIGMACWDIENNKACYIKAKAINLATGGAAYNEELIARYNPKQNDLGPVSGNWATGDGLVMAAEIGAALCGFKEQRRPGGLVEYHTHTSIYMDIDRNFTMSTPHAFVYVNQDGQRQIRECMGNANEYGSEFDSPQYAIFDQTLFENPDFQLTTKVSHDMMESFVESGWIWKADSIEELAEQLYIDPQALRETIDNFNEHAENGIDDELGRAASTMRVYDDGPYYAYKALPIEKDITLSFDVTDNYEVRDVDGIVFPGLYASGSKAIKCKGLGASEGYPGCGCYSMLGAVSSQYAGRFAAEYIKSLDQQEG